MTAWTSIDSSNIKACRYGKKQRLLLVWFHSGKMAMYSPVSWSSYMSFRKAGSHGGYFSAHIRNNKKIRWQYIQPSDLA